MAATRNRIWKITGWLLLALTVFFTLALSLLWLKLPVFINENLSEFVSEKSDGLYSLTIEDIEGNLLPFSLAVKGIHFWPDQKKARQLQQQSPNKMIYHVKAGKMEVGAIDFMGLIRNKRFSAQKIIIDYPEIEISGEDMLQNDSLRMADNIVSQVRPLFRNFLREIAIGRIQFTNAHVGLFTSANDSSVISKADQISLEVKGFRTNQAMLARPTRFFETDDVLVRIHDYRIAMGDSLHTARIDTVEYSLKTMDIRASGFHLFPLFRNQKKNMYEVRVPVVYVRSKSITRFALRDSLKISYLEFSEPSIKFFHKENPNRFKLEDIDKFDLYQLVQNQFSRLEVDSFQLTGAHLEIFRQPDYEHYQQLFKAIDITLNGFALDSTSALNREKILHSDDIEMQVADYHLRLEDNLHDFRADSLFVSTFSDRLGIKKIRIIPDTSSTLTPPTEVNIHCDALNIENVDLRNVYHTRTLPTSKIEIVTPDVQLWHHPQRKLPKTNQKAGILFDLVSDYLKGVYSNLVFIENGTLNIQNRQNRQVQGYFETGFTFSLTDFSLDSSSVKRTDKFFYATNFDLLFTDYNMRLVDDLHKLSFDAASFSSLNQEVEIENLRLEPLRKDVSVHTMQDFGRSELFNITVPQISLEGVDISNAFFYNQLKIDHFQIADPVVYFENFGKLRMNREKTDISEFYRLVFNYIHDFDIKKFSVPNGKLTWVNHTRKGKTISFDNEFSASLENFRLNEQELEKNRLFFSDNFDVSIRDQQFELSDDVHVLKAGEILLSSSTSSVNIKNALLYPLITSPRYSSLATTFQVAIPELKISRFDFQEAYYSGKPTINKLEILSPKIQVYNQSGKTKSLDLNQFKFPIPSEFKSLQLDEFKMIGGKVITYEKQGTHHRANANFSFNLSMPRVFIDNTPGEPLEFSGGNIVFNMTDFKAPLGESHNLSIENIHFNRNNQTISIDSLKVDPFFTQENDNVFRIFAPSMNFSAFDMTTAIRENQFHFDEIAINGPLISIGINKSLQSDTLRFLQTLDLFPYVEPYLNAIEVDNLRLQNAKLNLNWLKKELFSNEINLEFKDILIAENQPPANLLNSKEFEISTTGLRRTTPGKLYEFTADSLIYNSASHEVSLSSIFINPLIEREEFPRQKGFQTDVVKGHLDFIRMTDINERKWLQENILEASVLQIGPSQLEIFRNKRYPFNQNQRPPWPQDLIKNPGQPFYFDSVMLLPSKIKYSELLPISEQPGFVTFDDLQFSGGPLTNMAEKLDQKKYLNLQASTLIYGKSLLQANFRFDMSSPDYAHTVKGFLNPMPLTPLNQMLRKASPMYIEQGNLRQFEFDLSLNEERSQGELNMAYDNLKVVVLDYQNEKQQKSRFESFWANKMVLNTDYPKGGDPEPVPISYERDKKRSIINFWWKSIYSGAKKVLGIAPEE